MFDVFTIGSVTYDNFLIPETKIVKDDESPSKRAYFLPLGRKIEVLSLTCAIGGNSANAAVTFARQGFKTACLGKIGRDIYGQEIINFLNQENVATNFMIIDPKFKTAYSTIFLTQGERTILSYHGASHNLKISDFKFSHMKSKWWYVSLAGKSYKLFPQIVKMAYQNKIALAFNPSGYHLKYGQKDILKYLPFISVLFLNEEEAAVLAQISWKKEDEVFQKLDKLMPKILVITRGRKGSVISDNFYIYKAPIFKEKKLIDRTGAGDAFGAGFISGLLHRRVDFYNIDKVKPDDILYAIKLASANATSVVEKIGASIGALSFQKFNKDKRFKNLNIAIRKI